MKKYIVEFVASFFLIFCATGAVIIDQQAGGIGHWGGSVAAGMIVTLMILVFGSISGAHMNPVVTFVAAGMNLFPKKDVLPYFAAQIAGGIFASFFLHILFPENELLACTLPAGNEIQSFVLEIVLTFLLVIVILFLTQGSEQQKTAAPYAIGTVVALNILFAGPICGASMNPIRSLSPAVVSNHFEHLWIYLMAPFIGGILAGLFWKMIDSMKQ